MIKWEKLNDLETINKIKEESYQNPVVVFKHSIRCPISAGVLDHFEREWDEKEVPGAKAYYLDLINYRSVSNKIAESFSVFHESPQILLISRGECVFDTSHGAISFKTVKEAINNL